MEWSAKGVLLREWVKKPAFRRSEEGHGVYVVSGYTDSGPRGKTLYKVGKRVVPGRFQGYLRQGDPELMRIHYYKKVDKRRLQDGASWKADVVEKLLKRAMRALRPPAKGTEYFWATPAEVRGALKTAWADFRKGDYVPLADRASERVRSIVDRAYDAFTESAYCEDGAVRVNRALFDRLVRPASPLRDLDDPVL